MLDREEIECTCFVAGPAQTLRDVAGLTYHRQQICRPFFFASAIFKHIKRFFVGQSMTRIDQRFGETRVDQIEALVERQKCRETVTIAIRHQAAQTIGEIFWQHRDDPIDQIATGRALSRFLIKRRMLRDIMTDVGDMHAEHPATLGVFF